MFNLLGNLNPLTVSHNLDKVANTGATTLLQSIAIASQGKRMSTQSRSSKRLFLTWVISPLVRPVAVSLCKWPQPAAVQDRPAQDNRDALLPVETPVYYPTRNDLKILWFQVITMKIRIVHINQLFISLS